ncbi:hypothetical protein CYFUS_009442 [Cystobacter fuscus]|uniref:Lipoprotein n=1 Tax=Cystobacter fuscus TaxID=43 RepID=A0A250JKN6_9BACT|nr:hypothetical protein [Cystobacter fuscus]ATB43961.1 hypothetical protein CYFUS_009442 [Cystobacter fuscus]
MTRVWRKSMLVLLGLLGLGGCAGPSRTQKSSALEDARRAEERLAEQVELQESSADEDERTERESFAQKAIAALREAGETRPIRYDAEGFLLELGDKDPSTVFLGNFFDEYRATPPEQRHEVLGRLTHVRSPPTMPEAFADVRPHLMPVVRGRAFFERLRLEVKGRKDLSTLLSWKPLGGFLGVGLAFDGPDTLRYLGPDELRRWGVSFEEALTLALENLRQRSPESLERLAPGTCQAPWQDTYAASRLLLEEVVRRCPVRGEPVVLVPHRDLLLITGSDDEDGLSRVARMSLDALLAPRAQDGRALRLTSGTWVPFMPERLSNAWKDFRQLELFTQARDYDEQTQQLDKHYQGTGEDVFVAAFTPYQDEHGRSLSYAVWQKGMTTLLPRAELIFFVDPAQGERAAPVGVARWEDVAKVTGALGTPVEGLYPERYRVRDFPSDEQLARWRGDPGDLFDENER